jgi:lipopolysaccharide biosynthesis glycosyltransferase
MGPVAGSSDPSDPIHIICAADARYGAYAGIMLSSVLNSNELSSIHCHLLDDGVHARDRNRMARMAQRAGGALSIYNIKDKLDEHPDILQRMAHYTRPAFGRLFIPEFLPKSISRIIYFDCDVICTSSLRELWDIGGSAGILGAVRDEWVDRDAAHKLSIGMPADAAYYNSGVLLINLAEWRKRSLSMILLKYLSSVPKTLYPDQDAINSLLWSEITELSGKWNVLITSPEPGRAIENLNAAVNIHFCGGFKPWHIGYACLRGPASDTFRRAKALSPWKWKPSDFHFGRMTRKLTDSLSGRFGRPRVHQGSSDS